MLEIDLKIILHSFYTHSIIFNIIYCWKMKPLSNCFPVVLNTICKTSDKYIRDTKLTQDIQKQLW